MSKVQTILENFGVWIHDLSVKKYSFVIVREHFNRNGVMCNPQVFVKLDDNKSLSQQNKETKDGIKSIKNITIDLKYLDEIARYFSNDITKADDLKPKMLNEKSVNEVSIL